MVTELDTGDVSCLRATLVFTRLIVIPPIVVTDGAMAAVARVCVIAHADAEKLVAADTIAFVFPSALLLG